MRIGYDAKRFFNNYTGLGNYARTLISTFLVYDKSTHLTLFTTKNLDNARNEFINGEKNISIFEPKSLYFKALWRTFGIIKDINEQKIDIYHGLSNELPLNIKRAKCKSVVTIHDLIYERNPEFYPWLDRILYAFKYRKSCNNADQIVAISEQTKKDIIDFYHIHPSKITVIYQSCHEQFSIIKEKSAIELVKQELQLPDQYMLYVGTINERKNLMKVIEAMNLIGEDSLPLVVIGDGKEYLDLIRKKIEAFELKHKVFIFNKIDFSKMPEIYQGASIFLYPSYFEGFGIPIIEALYSRVPVITSIGSCFGEAGGPDSKYIDPENPISLKNAIQEILNDDILRMNMIEKGRSYVSKFDKQVIANEWNSFYHRLAESY